MNYSSHWIFYGNLSIVWLLLYGIYFYLWYHCYECCCQMTFCYSGNWNSPVWAALETYVKMWFGTAQTEMSPGLSPHPLTCCWSNRGSVWLPLAIDSFFHSSLPFLFLWRQAGHCISRAEDKCWLAYGENDLLKRSKHRTEPVTGDRILFGSI